MRSTGSETKRPLFLAFQGGAALGAFSLGVVEALYDHDPQRKIIGATGTSSGALTAAFFAEGYIKGGYKMAVNRSVDCWKSMAAYQGAECSNFWFNLSDFEQIASLSGSLPIIRAMMGAASEVGYHAGQPALSSSPILAFLAKIRQAGNPLDFSAIQRSKDFTLIANATHVPVRVSPWKAKACDERVFTNMDITPQVLAASGALMELVPPIQVNGEPLRDGAYFSNPHLQTAAKICMEQGADLLVIRTRPSGAFPALNGREPRTDDERRAFFNNMLDAQLAEVRQEFPKLKISVIEPSTLEGQSINRIFKPELSFNPEDIEARRVAGYNTATEVISHDLDVFPKLRTLRMNHTLLEGASNKWTKDIHPSG